MEISNISSFATHTSQTQIKENVELAVLKKSIDIQTQGALQLIEALPDLTPSDALPANLGKNINVVV